MTKPHLPSSPRAATLLAIATALAACGTPRVIQVSPAAAEADRPGSMIVTGQATLEVSPDCADLTITLAADAPVPGAAVADVERKQQALIAAMQAIGVPRGDLKLSQLQLDPIHDPAREGWAMLRVRTYRARITITATTRTFARIGDMMSAAAAAGATSMSTAFRRDDLPALKQQVRDQALAAARAKAAQTATALGIRLGRIISVAESQGGTMWSSAYFPQAGGAAAPGAGLGGVMQPLTLEVTIGFELPARS